MIRHDDATCPACGKARSEWRTNNSEGVMKAGQAYCCEGCAEGRDCTCTLLQAAPRPLRNVDPTPGI